MKFIKLCYYNIGILLLICAAFETVQSRNAEGNVVASYVFDAALLETWNISAINFPLLARVGSIRIATDISGNIIQSNNYGVFGNAR